MLTKYGATEIYPKATTSRTIQKMRDALYRGMEYCQGGRSNDVVFEIQLLEENRKSIIQY